MGTRHLIAVVQGGDYKVAQYGQFDGYPSGQGVIVLQFLRDVLQEEAVVSFITAVKNCSFYTDAELKAFTNVDPFPEQLNRELSAGILPLILKKNGLKVCNGISFAADSLFCEWLYLIDLDKDTFEVYKGFNDKKLTKKDRFFNLSKFADGGYEPVKLAKKWSLNKLPSDTELYKLAED